MNKPETHANKPEATEPSQRERMEQCSQELAQLLAKYGAVLLALPSFKPDGRGGWFIDCAIQIAPRGP